MKTYASGKQLMSYKERKVAQSTGYQDELGLSGHVILDKARDRWISRWVSYPGEPAVNLFTLWAMHTHFRVKGTTGAKGKLIWRATPRLFLFSHEPASGKTTALEELNLICPNTFGLDIDVTQYGLQYSLEQDHATVLLDEGDLGAMANGTIAVINAGYTRNGQVLNGSRSKPTRVPVFGPIALGALDSMKYGKNAKRLEAMFTRGFQIIMEPGPHDKWCRLTEQTGAIVNKAFAWWSEVAMENDMIDTEPEMPGWLDYRDAQIMAPLKAVADAAGGEWPKRFEVAVSTAADFAEELMAL